MAFRTRSPRSALLATLSVVTALVGPSFVVRAAQDEHLRLVFHGYVDGRARIGIGEIRGSRLARLEDLPGMRAGPEISPDGTRIAFDTCSKSDRGINVANLDGSEVRRVAPMDGDHCVDIRWSRDSSRLSYSSPIDRQLHILDLDTGVDTALTPTVPALGWHSWSPNGDAIVYETGRGGQRRLLVIDLTSWRTRELVGRSQFAECEVWAPDWSPAGDLIAFTTCKRQLYVVRPDGSGLTRIAEDAYAPRWSTSGASVLYLSGWGLLSVPPIGGVPKHLGRLPYMGGPFSVGRIR